MNLVIAILIGASLIGAIAINMEVQRRSTVAGDGLIRTWSKGCLAGAIVMACAAALLFAAGHILR